MQIYFFRLLQLIPLIEWDILFLQVVHDCQLLRKEWHYLANIYLWWHNVQSIGCAWAIGKSLRFYCNILSEFIWWLIPCNRGIFILNSLYFDCRLIASSVIPTTLVLSYFQRDRIRLLLVQICWVKLGIHNRLRYLLFILSLYFLLTIK